MSIQFTVFEAHSFCPQCFDQLSSVMRKSGYFPTCAALQLKRHYGTLVDDPVYFQLESTRAKLFFRRVKKGVSSGPAKK